MKFITELDIKQHKIINYLIKQGAPYDNKPIVSPFGETGFSSSKIIIEDNWKSAKVYMLNEYAGYILITLFNYDIKNIKCIYKGYSDTQCWFKDIKLAIEHVKHEETMIDKLKQHYNVKIGEYGFPKFGCGKTGCTFCMMYEKTGVMPTTLPTIPIL